MLRLKKYWANAGIASVGNATDSQFEAFERTNGVVLPCEIRAYFKIVNGTVGGSSMMADEDYYAFYQFSEFRPLTTYFESNSADDKDIYVFADHSAWVWALGVRLSNRSINPSQVIGIFDNERILLTETFAEYVERYLWRDYSVRYL